MQEIKLKNKLVSSAAVYLLSNIANALIPFALLPILTRYLNPSEYGEVAMFQTLLAALGSFVGLNVAGAANRKHYDYDAENPKAKEFIASCLQILLFSGIIIFIITFIFRKHISEWLDLKYEWIFWSVFCSVGTVVITIRLGQWQIKNEALNYGLMQASQSLINMMLSIFFITTLLAGASGRIYAQIISIALFSAISLYLLNKKNLLEFFSWNPKFIKEALVFGVPLIPHVGGAFLLNTVDRIVINSMLGLEKAGIYMVAVQISLASSLVFNSINNAYVPWLFERLKRNKIEEKIKIVRYTYIWFILIAIGTIFAIIGGPWFVSLMAGDNYSQSGDVIGWLILGQSFGGMYLMVTNYIFYSKRTGLLSTVTLLSGSINIFLLFYLVKYIGLSGAAIAFAISMAIRFFLTWWVAQKSYPMPWFNFKTAK